MNILVIGGGAVGGYLASKLEAANHPMTLVSRTIGSGQPITLLELRNGYDTPLYASPRIVPTISAAFAEQARYRLAILAVRDSNVTSALAQLAPYVEQIDMLLTLQNGLGAEEKAMQTIGARYVLAGALTSKVTRTTAGELRCGTTHGLTLAPTYSGWFIGDWVRLFEQAGFNCRAVENVTALKWSNLLVKLIGSGTASILGWTPTQVYGHDRMTDIEIGLLREVVGLMKKRSLKPIDLPGYSIPQIVMGLNSLPRFALKNLLVRRLDERVPLLSRDIVHTHGAVARAGWDEGIAVPSNTAITEIGLRLARGELPREAYHNQPDALWEAVKKRKARR